MTWPEAIAKISDNFTAAAIIVGCSWAAANMFKWWRQSDGKFGL